MSGLLDKNRFRGEKRNRFMKTLDLRAAAAALKQKCCHFDEIFIMATPEVVKMITSSEASDGNFIKMMIPQFQCIGQFLRQPLLGLLSILVPRQVVKYLKPIWRQGMALQWRHNERDGVSNHQSRDCLLNRLFRRRSKKTSKLRVTGLCVGNSPVTGEFPAQRASNAGNVSIWWRHHEKMKSTNARSPIELQLLYLKHRAPGYYPTPCPLPHHSAPSTL